MGRTTQISAVCLVLLGLVVMPVVSQEVSPSGMQTSLGVQVIAGPEAGEKGEGEAKGESKSKGESKDETPIPVALPQAMVIGKVGALCASDQFLVKILPIEPPCAGAPPIPQWLIFDKKVTPEGISLVSKAAEKDWTVAVWFGPDWVVTSVCVQLYPK